MNALRTAHTADLDPAELHEIHALLEAAFEGDFDEDDWDHTIGGIHAWLRDERGVAAHGSVVQRRVQHAGRSLRVGYVEGVAVRADRRREGLGGLVMEALERVIDRAYVLGALSASDDGAALYAGRGWVRWPGRIAALGPSGVVPLPDEEGTTYLRPVAGLPDASEALLFDWRDGDVL
ncbi:aminoglycoside 2'-N-acetyltransferase [Streptomyces agglomeratus]|uniref:Aminoglycoside 2'-N-acetyltransferase n=1 Tax=Streptomyces agglomeratus TaxID=285458 RepID=A0A1E5PIK0_9ACTN|nr:GNAT family N-acetyltransferase [Streptomyces agglomeratus]OEJ29359.1 aminoglycoside 2'-N-acetyltransferase [Streptomyces agglomeratus]OEJ55949.1 aminoglycoside 2'-N-acetyltransferase [Streptomyces agglomeratus]OEJ63328.1 aminoglycoside 2'-N-acetyltransferase [Streptomyces agglomeratus]